MAALGDPQLGAGGTAGGLASVVGHAIAAFGAAGGWLALVEDASWHVLAPEGREAPLRVLPDGAVVATRRPPQGLVWHALETGEALFVEDTTASPRTARRAQNGIGAVAIVPVGTAGHELGALVLNYSAPRPFSSVERAAISLFGACAALVLERVRGLAARQVGEERFRSLVEDVDAVVWEAVWPRAAPDGAGDPTGPLRFTYVSRQAEALLGYPRERWLAENGFWEALIHPEDRAGVLARCFAAAQRAERHEEQFRVTAADGATLWVRCLISAAGHGQQPAVPAGDVPDAAPSADVRLHGVMLDVTAQKELEQQAERLAATEKLRALGQMASGIAHDLNNALAPVVGFSELLRTQPHRLRDPETVRRDVELIHAGAVDAAEVVRRMREFYRPRESDENLVPVDLRAVAEQAVALTEPKWRNEARADGRTIDVAVVSSPEPATARGDAAALREALTNLLFNAVDALPSGGRIEVRVSAQAHWAVLEVADNGAGMPEDVRRRALEPFFTTKGERGTGLGLAMVHGIVQRHSGELDIASCPGGGTSVRLRLPRHEGDPERAPPAAGPGRPVRVLLADDEPVVREVVEALLRADGHAVRTVASGAAALQAMTEGGIDVLITDRSMPGMSGDEVAVAAKRLSPQVRVVLLTGFGDLMAAAGERPDGVDWIAAKPVTFARLREALAHVLD